MYKTADPCIYDLLRQNARSNRKAMTTAERILWNMIRRRSLGTKFLRQHVIGDYIVDFISLEFNLIIEVDGGYHGGSLQQQEDAVRQQWLEQRGYKVIRFTNEQVEFETSNVLSQLKNVIEGLERAFCSQSNQ